MKRDKNYRDVYYDEQSGGMKATHVGHNKPDKNDQPTFQDK